MNEYSIAGYVGDPLARWSPYAGPFGIGPIPVATTSDARTNNHQPQPLERDNQFVSGHVVKTEHSERSRNYYNFSLGTSRALAEKLRTLPFAEA